MRYPKGTFVVNCDHDIPLLLQVRNSRFITHQQLFELMVNSGREYSRKTFNWRVKRLVDFKCISICDGNFGKGALIYRVARGGLLQLEDHGHFATVLNSRTEHLPHVSQIHHALELNAIHLALAHADTLATWKSEVEIASANTLAAAPLAKDYDAVVNVWNEETLACFALEYERTLKSARQYDKIRQALESEDRIGCVLYVTAGLEMVDHLAQELSGIPKRLAFTTSPEFRKGLLDTPVVIYHDQPKVPFRQLLRSMF